MNMSKAIAGQGDWVQAMKDAWGSVPASDLLNPDSKYWGVINLSAPDSAECASFAMAGRALKYGRSMAIALPVLGGEALTRLMVYLHRIRMDALQGGIRSPWLNPSNMEQSPHVVFISRPRAGFHDISRVADLRARVLRGSDTKRTKASTSQTLVVDGSSGVMDLVETIGRGSKPFIFVIDGTRGGNDNAAAVDSALEESFPQVPRITLLSLGDNESLGKMRTNGSRSHLWLMRMGDKHLLHPPAIPGCHFALTVIQDARANAELGQIADRFFGLRRELERQDVVLKNRLAVIGKVFRSFNELPVPLRYLESTLQAATRPGLYPIRCLERWLEIAGQGSTLYAQSDMNSRNLINQMTGVHQLFGESTTGKAAWLLKHLQGAFAEQRATLVLCGSPHEVTALQDWLDSELDEGWNGTIQISAMDGVKAYRQYGGPVTDVIITGMLWPSRQHWLATPCRRLMIPSYEYEKPYLQRMLQLWWINHGAESYRDGDKLTQWQLGWTDRRCEDLETDSQSLALEPTYYPDCSQYPPRVRHVAIPLDMEYENWFDLLVEQPVEPKASVQGGEALAPDLVWISIEGADAELPWSKTRPVLVLREEEIHPTQPDDLAAGDQIILLKHTDERIATQETLFEMVAVSEGLQQFLRAAGRWKTMVDGVSARMSVAQVQIHLRKEGVTVGDATVASWYRHKVYGPRDRAAVTVFARLSGTKQPEKASVYVSNGIEQLRVAHQKIGKELRKAILERGKGATTIEIGQLKVDGHAFDDMIEFARVSSIRAPSVHVVASKDEALIDIANDIIQAHPGRICLTNPAVKSMRDSVYANVTRFRTCLSLMATQLYDHYNNRTIRFNEVLKHFEQELIVFKPQMSPVTMGMYADDRRYKGKPADMNKHFCLGNARDPVRTLRIHYEWDADDKLLVIHHAGKHLETTQS
ncbi:hypothetical protein NTD86_10335 [Pseudomonas sp. 7P_10.2_Bac1]|uniref:DISARM anti-phage system protein DrmE domain-containing protein n=1 Tax=Pseudomonas sp. 7P_10.2_Bac1 TaxID=2971614 RepID=UPI0021CAAC68|nr:hypothetical protein [Pseudomonas sp. 7P_10.2_Bac1]MCU1727381.1 hypothetical protein [Pseudomonas sp. 7P_10.2_Bac1]